MVLILFDYNDKSFIKIKHSVNNKTKGSKHLFKTSKKIS